MTPKFEKNISWTENYTGYYNFFVSVVRNIS